MDPLDGFGIFSGTALEHMIGQNQVRPTQKEASHFSFWSYSHYWECPLRYFWLVVDRRVSPSPVDKRPSLEGGAMHVAMDKLLKARPDDIGGWVSGNAQDCFDEYLEECKKEGFKWKSQMDPATAYEKYLKLLLRASFYVKHKVFDDPMVKEIHSELPFLVRVLPGVTIGGRMDLTMLKQAHPDTPPFIDIVDWKGTSNTFSTSRDQLMFYALAAMALMQLPVRFVSFAYPALNKEALHKFSEADYEGFIYKLQVVAEKIKLGERVAATEPNACRWCVYKEACDQKPLKNIELGRPIRRARGS